LKSTWIVFDNHLALRCGNEILHPSAADLYDVLTDERVSSIDGAECDLLREAFPELHISKVGSDLNCILQNGSNNDIEICFYAVRRKQNIMVDMIDGEIIDQCIHNNEWFYVTGITKDLLDILKNIGITKSGRITVSQYLGIMRNIDQLGKNVVFNEVESSLLDKPINEQEDLPFGLQAKLYAYQKTGYFWMRYMLSENSGCILGDEMGLGKTLQVITLMLDYKQQKKIPMLVVAPVSLLQNWKRECEKFAPRIKTLIHHGTKRTGRYKELLDYDLVIVSYNSAVSDSSLLGMIYWKLVVLDEAQNIKNPGSDRTKYVKKIPRQSCIAVTGTPFENHVTDIWSLVDFVIPGSLGTQSEYSSFISDDVEGADNVQPLLSPIMIRRMVSNVATDLPEKVIIPQPLVMSDKEAIRYEDYREQASNESQNGAIGLGALQKLRMFCTHPNLCIEDEKMDIYSCSVKYQRMCEIIEEIVSRKEKVILFTSFQKMFEILDRDIPERFGMPVLKINGSTPVEDRQNLVDEFNDVDGIALLALNPRAAGTGLNITSANHVIHYNLEWNPALEDQASARAYRRGQEKTVFVYRLFYEDTVEQIVNERIERKREIADVAIVGTDGSTENREDIIAAVTISPIRRKNQ
jgi:SNF2 family DNA or RNA helicase